MSDQCLPIISKTRSSTLYWLLTNTSWMINLPYVRSSGSILLLTRVTEWKTRKASSLWRLDKPTLLHTEYCLRARRSKTIWLSYGVFSISCCQRFSTRVRSSRNGLINRWVECTQLLQRLLKKKIRRFLNYRKKNNYLSLTDYIKFLDHFC